MNAGELVISLLLKAGSFKSDLAGAQNSLNRTREAGRKAMNDIADAARDMSDGVVRGSQNAKSGLDSLADTAGDVSDELAQVSKDAQKAGKNLQDAAQKGEFSFKSLLPTLTKVAGIVGVVLSVKGLVSTYLDQADAIGKYSDALNLNVEDVQAWEEAVKHAGGKGEEFKSTLNGLTQRLTEAATMGTGEMVNSLEKLGISAKDASGKTKGALDFLPELAEKFEKMSAADAAGFGQKLGIDKGTIMLLQQGRKATEEAIKAGKEHIKFTKADAEAAARANDAIQDMQTAFMAVAMRAIAPLIPLLGLFAKVMHSIAQWVSENQEAVIAFFTALAIASGVKAAPAILKLGSSLKKLKAAFGLVGIAVTLLAGLFDELWAFITGGDSIIERFLLRIRVSKETLESLRSVLRSVIGFFLDLWDAITGDKKSADAAWNRVKATWEGAMNFLGGLVRRIKSWFAGLVPDWLKKFVGDTPENREKLEQSNQASMGYTGTSVPAVMVRNQPTPGQLSKGAVNVDNSKNIDQKTNVTQNIYPAPGMDEQGLANKAADGIRSMTAQFDGAY